MTLWRMTWSSECLVVYQNEESLDLSLQLVLATLNCTEGLMKIYFNNWPYLIYKAFAYQNTRGDSE